MPEIGLATIYRMINVLEEAGAIKRENMYRVVTQKEESSAQKCVVQFEDEQFVELDQKSF